MPASSYEIVTAASECLVQSGQIHDPAVVSFGLGVGGWRIMDSSSVAGDVEECHGFGSQYGIGMASFPDAS